MVDADDVFSASIQSDSQQLVFVSVLMWDQEETFAFKHPSHATRAAQVPTIDFKDFPDFAGGAVAVLRQDVAEHGHTAGTIALVRKLDELIARGFAAAFLDSPIDVVLGHAGFSGPVDGVPQGQIRIGIAATLLSGNNDCSAEFGEELSAFCVGDSLFVLDARPVRVSSHGDSSW